MSETATIARPYAKAIFEHALATDKLSLWSDLLMNLAYVANDTCAESFLSDPRVTDELQYKFLSEFCGEAISAHKDMQNLLRLLIQNRRVALLPEIYHQYTKLKSEQEKNLVANVESFMPLDNKQLKHLQDALSKRLQYQVTLETTINPELLGGAVIKVGDLVIDGSVRGQLNKLSQSLTI